MKKRHDPNYLAYLAAKAREEHEEELFLAEKEGRNLDDEVEEIDFPHKIKRRIEDINYLAYLAGKAREEYEEEYEEEEE